MASSDRAAMNRHRWSILLAVFVLAGALGLSALAHASFNAVLLVPLLVVVGGLLLVVTLILAALPVRRRVSFWPLSILLAGIALTCVGMVRGMNWRFDRVEREFAPLIAALEAYRAEKGTYPESLEALVPDRLEKLPACDLAEGRSEPGRPVERGYQLMASDRFSITCYTVVFWKYSYNSQQKEWYGWD
ncbi:hypothetical protein LY474_37375 [Myxococcus stipitatus]|uniref:hypothetical protein n=1 Tax=Myxococcus stipitatus TaxID=83455 RepID=UPI001F3723AC|nr:hypothetical protein [Myxococcus stipitatus]MCE9673494.1 hypothetical protein [Myxococcus stipitatus]